MMHKTPVISTAIVPLNDPKDAVEFHVGRQMNGTGVTVQDRCVMRSRCITHHAPKIIWRGISANGFCQGLCACGVAGEHGAQQLRRMVAWQCLIDFLGL